LLCKKLDNERLISGYFASFFLYLVMKKGLKNLSKSALIALIEQQQASLIQKGENEFRLQSDKERLQVEKAHLKVEKTYLEAQIAELRRMRFGKVGRDLLSILSKCYFLLL
jgi:hypothetical protein